MRLKNKNLYKRYGIESGDIILEIEDQKVSSVIEVENLLKKYQNKDYVVLQMLTQQGKIGYIRLKDY